MLIPLAVLEELKVDTDFPGAEQIRQAMANEWLKVKPLDELSTARALQRDLDHGESKAIALALQLGDRKVLIDEHDGREVARVMGLHPIGLLGVLLRAKSLHNLTALKPVMLALQQKAGFYSEERLFQQDLRR